VVADEGSLKSILKGMRERGEIVVCWRTMRGGGRRREGDLVILGKVAASRLVLIGVGEGQRPGHQSHKEDCDNGQLHDTV